MLSEQGRRSWEKPAQVRLSLLSAQVDAADEGKEVPEEKEKLTGTGLSVKRKFASWLDF